MKSGDAFKGSFLKADDIKGHRVAVVIESVSMEEVGQGEDKSQKPVLHFMGKEKGLVLNKTNWARIADFLGSDDSDDWESRGIILGVERVDFQGRRVDAIRVIGVPKGEKPSKPKPVEVEPEPIDEGDAAQYDDDSVPF